MSRSNWCVPLSAAAIVLSVGSPGVTYAQQERLELEEVVVTAEKREVNLQQVSASIQVKSGEDLAKTGKKRIDEIMQGTPGIQAQSNATGLTFFVRGVDAQSGQPGVVTQNPVAVLIDGVSQSRQEVVRGGTLDVSRAEIMRGPQSTTLGANALSGAVSLVSNQPVLGEYQANGSLELGNYEKRAVEGVFNAPLGETTALRLAYANEKRDGYLSSGAGESDNSTVRAKLRWQPSDTLDIVLTASSNKIGGNGTQQNVLLANGYWMPVTNTNAASVGINTALTGGSCVSTNPAITLRGCPATYYNDGTGVSFRDRSNPWDDGFPSDGFDNNPHLDTRVNVFSTQIDWDLGIGTLTVLPSFQNARNQSVETPMGGSFMTRDGTQDTSTLDITLNSKGDGALKWQGGLYYRNDKTEETTGFISYPGGGMGMGPTDTATACAYDSGPVPDPLTTPEESVNCYEYEYIPNQEQTSLSAYANAEFSLLDTLRLVGGVRYSKDKFDRTIINYGPGAMGAGGDSNGVDQAALAALARISSGSISGPTSVSKATYRVGVEYDVLPETMLYAVYSTGYTPGQYSITADMGMGECTTGAYCNTLAPAVELKQITAGFKSQLLDNRLQFNGELFRSTYYNRGVQGAVNVYINGANSNNCTPTPGGPPSALTVASTGTGGFCALVGQDTARVPQFVSQGADLDLTWLISANDRLALTYEYLKAQYDAAPKVYNGTALVDISTAGIESAGMGVGITTPDAAALSTALNAYLNGFVGTQLQNAPQSSATLDYQHTFNLPGGSTLVPRVAATYKTKYWSAGGSGGITVSSILNDSSSANPAWQQAYTTWDAFLGWTSADGKLGVNGYVKNLNNEVVLANYTFPFVSIQAPRTVGLIFNVRL